MNSSFFTDAIKHFPDAILVVNREGLIMYVNSKMLELFEFTNEEDVLGRGIWELSQEHQKNQDKSAQDAALQMIAIAAAKGENHFEWQHAKKDGKVFYADVNLKPLNDENEGLFISSVRDITRRKMLEMSLTKKKQTSDESSQQKLDFLSNMSHEIRTPLNVIIGFTELLEFTDISQNDYKEYAEIIRANGNMLQRLIEDIIDISKIETDKLKVVKSSFNVNQLLNEVYQSLSINLEADKVSMKLVIPPFNEGLILNSDPCRIKQILTNLITNAQKFTSQGEINFGYQIVNNKRIEFFVQDTGKGISEDDLSLIFNRFEQGNTIDINEIKGFGLGLAISRGLTQIMGGKIHVESELNVGSRFSVDFPLKHGKESSDKRKPKSGLDLTGVRILIAEDVSENYEFLHAVLSRTNASLVWAKNGLEAVEYIKNEPFDIALFDIKMPVMDGYEALERVRKTHTSLPIMAQTAYALDYDRSKGLAAGFNDFISKPIKIELLLEKIAVLLNIKVEDKQ